MKPTRPSLLIIGHGSSSSKEAEDAVLAHALTLRQSNRFGNVLTYFLTEGATLPVLPEGEVFILPFFMSDGFFVQEKIPSLFNLEEFERHEKNRSIYQCDALGVDPELSTVLKAMASEASVKISKNTAEVSLVLVAHGSSKSAASADAAQLQAQTLRQTTNFRSISTAFLEETPSIGDELNRLLETKENVVCLGLFAADGPHGGDDVPNAIEETLETRAGDEGAIVYYAGVAGTRPEIVRLIQNSISRKAENLKID